MLTKNVTILQQAMVRINNSYDKTISIKGTCKEKQGKPNAANYYFIIMTANNFSQIRLN